MSASMELANCAIERKLSEQGHSIEAGWERREEFGRSLKESGDASVINRR